MPLRLPLWFAALGCMLVAWPASAHVNLLSPEGGETFGPGQTVVVQWEIFIPHDQMDWDLYYSTDNGDTWLPVALNLPVAQLTYTWTVPAEPTALGRIRIVQDNGSFDYEDISGAFTIYVGPAAVEGGADGPATPALVGASPNPFAGRTTLTLDLPHQSPVTVEVFDVRGSRVAVLAEETLSAGEHLIVWSPGGLPSGVYLCRLTTDAVVETRKLLIVR